MGLLETYPAIGSATDLPPLPAYWAIKLDKEDWPECAEIALFHTHELWLEPLVGESPDLVAPTGNSQVAIIRDRTGGIGKDRVLNWEVAVVDPRIEDVLTEINEEPASKRQRQ